MLKFPLLFEPVRIGGRIFRNRIFSSPQDTYRLTPDGNFLDDDAAAFYEYKALGGFASVCVGDFMVDAVDGHSHPFQLNGGDIRGRVSLTKTASAITRHGAAAAAELNHAGENSNNTERGFVFGVSDGVRPDGTPVRAYGAEQIERLIEKYAAAAKFAVQCGFGMITLHGGHGWLLAQFMSEASNRRRDEWGGNLENRMRFPLAVTEAVRRAAGRGIVIEMRISGAEYIPGGYDIDEGIRIAECLDGKVDLIHVSAGHHESDAAAMITHPTLFDPDGSNAHLAAAIKKRVKTPVAAVGGFTDPYHMEEFIKSGGADVIALARQTLADPFLPKKARAGREDEITKCLRCFTCFSASTVSGIFYCAVNPVTGNERDALYAPPAAVHKRVLVAGGGAGGMQAALTARERGHEVILCEKSGVLGGVLRCEENVPFKQKLREYLERQSRMLYRAGVDVRLNTEVTPELARGIAPEVIIAAIGAAPLRPNIPGIEKTVMAEEVYRDASLAGQTALIIGGGLVGLELGIYLAKNGRDVTVVEMLPYTAAQDEQGTSERISNVRELSYGENIVHGVALAQEMKKIPNLKTVCSTRVLEIKDGAARVSGSQGEYEIPAGTIICAAGQSPKSDEAWRLASCAPEFYAIGDCVSPRNIQSATREAYQIARDIGTW